MPLPDCLIVGAMKAGSTSLYHAIFLNNPDCIPAFVTKEIQYFSLFYDYGLEWYKTQFITTVDKFIKGEGSPYYLFHPLVPSRVKKDLPNVKIIALLRNPIDRAYSHFHHNLKFDAPTTFPDFETELKMEEIFFQNGLEHLLCTGKSNRAHQKYSYLARGRYAEQLKRWYDCFPKEQILVLQSEKLFKGDPQELKKISEFLGISLVTPLDRLMSNKYLPMNSDTRVRLKEYFKPHNEELYGLLGQDYGW